MGAWIEDGKEQRSEWRLALFGAKFAINLGRDASRIGKTASKALHQIQKMREPYTGGETLAGNVADGDAQEAAELDHFEEITGEMANRKDLAGDFVTAPIEFAGSAEAALDLGGFKDGLLEQMVLAAFAIEFFADGMDGGLRRWLRHAYT